MRNISFETIQQVDDHYGIECVHPMVTVVHYRSTTPIEETVFHYGVYALFLKETKGCTLSYGRTPYDFDEMTVTSFAPGQKVTVRPTNDAPEIKCTGLFFHPDFLARTQLGRNISKYEFFGYNSTEALHLSAQEVEIFREVLTMIEQEMHHAIDKHTRQLIVSNIELLLNYCLRFYDRQFITREEINHSVVKKFDTLLKEYIKNDAQKEGLPSVAYFADKCCLSVGYFGELIKTETGHTAKEYITNQLLAESKELLSYEDLTISQVSNRLGFEYPQHFVRFFKRNTGVTPSEYRKAV